MSRFFPPLFTTPRVCQRSSCNARNTTPGRSTNVIVSPMSTNPSLRSRRALPSGGGGGEGVGAAWGVGKGCGEGLGAAWGGVWQASSASGGVDSASSICCTSHHLLHTHPPDAVATTLAAPIAFAASTRATFRAWATPRPRHCFSTTSLHIPPNPSPHKAPVIQVQAA